MTRKDFERIAAILAFTRSGVRDGYNHETNGPQINAALGAITVVEEGLIRMFKHDNPRFDEERFKAASRGH